jgi:hypothetical protein
MIWFKLVAKLNKKEYALPLIWHDLNHQSQRIEGCTSNQSHPSPLYHPVKPCQLLNIIIIFRLAGLP